MPTSWTFDASQGGEHKYYDVLRGAPGRPRPAGLAPGSEEFRRAYETAFQSSWQISIIEFFGLVGWKVLFGLSYFALVWHQVANIPLLVVEGVLIALLFCGAERVIPPRATAGRRNSRSLFQSLMLWCGTFLILSFLVFMLGKGIRLSRLAELSFFVTGLPVAHLLKRGATKLLAGFFYNRSLRTASAIVLGVSDDAIAGTTLNLHARGCRQTSIIKLDAIKDDEVLVARVRTFGQECYFLRPQIGGWRNLCLRP